MINVEKASGRFVVQKHQAINLHYDFRLEMDNVPKSWAMPKEPPVQHGIRRLAVEVDDRPLNYIDFESIIHEGIYGLEGWKSGTKMPIYSQI